MYMNKKTIGFIAPLLIFCTLLGFLAVGLTRNPHELPSPLIGKPAPAFSSPDLLYPEQIFRSTQLKGKVWLLNVWASWCTACRIEHPLLSEIARRNRTPIVGLNYKDSNKDALAWLQKFGNPYTHLPVDANGDVGIQYGVYGVPETYLVDKSGRITFKHVGPITPKVVEQLLLTIKQLRAEPTPS